VHDLYSCWLSHRDKAFAVTLQKIVFFTGLAVVWDMLLTTQFLTLVMLTVWRLPTPVAACFHLFFSAIEATYFSACAEKVPTGKAQMQYWQCIISVTVHNTRSTA